MRRAFMLAVALAAACASAPPAPQPQPYFALQSNFWVNLHHFIRAAGRGMPLKAPLTADEQRAWDTAVTLYRERYSQRDLLHDDGMVAIKDALRRVPANGKPALAGEPELTAALISAAPIYRKYWWPAHDTLNRSWIASVQPLLARYGGTLSRRVPAAYGERWPAKPHPVDLSISAGPNGAYTSSPPHTTIASSDAGYFGPAALEMLFHEASHQWGKRLYTGLDESAATHHKTIPPQLWHAVLFYNAGELTRRTFAEDGYTNYVEFALRGKLYEAMCGDGCRERVAAAWNRHLDGSVSMNEALEALVASWPAAQ